VRKSFIYPIVHRARIRYAGVMNILTDLGTIIVVATIIAIVAHWLKQPLVVAYLATGVLLSVYVSGVMIDQEMVTALAKVGVVFLLFLVGMELDWRKLRATSGSAIGVGVIQVALTTLLGYVLARWLGLLMLPALYVGFGTAFASTILVVAALDRSRELNTLHGRLVLGILFVQDLIAIACLIGLAGIAQGGLVSVPQIITTTLMSSAALFAFTWFAATVLLPPLFASIADSHELALLAALGWAFLLTGLSASLGLSIEIGALLAGISLASLPQGLPLRIRIRPIRDFFLLIFFVSLGLQFAAGPQSINWGPVLILSLFVLIGRPVMLYVLLGLFGYRPRTAFLTAIPTAEVSEFSLIIAAMGISLNHLTAADGSLIIGVAIVTFTVGTYLTSWRHQLYKLIHPLLRWPKHAGTESQRESSDFEQLDNHTILVGARHIGHAVLRSAHVTHQSFVVIDLDPTIIDRLDHDSILTVLGDATEESVLESVRTKKAAQLIITIGDGESSEQLVRLARSMNHHMRIIVMARDSDDALRLYEAGADYVAISHHISGDVLVRFLKDVADHPSRLSQIRESHLEELRSDTLDFRLAHHHLGEHR